MRTVDATPDYAQLRAQFLNELTHQVEHLTRCSAAERKAAHGIMAPLCVALNAITDVTSLRTVQDTATGMLTKLTRCLED